MSTVTEIIEAVKRLGERQKGEFLDKLAEIDFDDEWDREIEADAKAGRLDRFAEEAIREHREGKSRPFPWRAGPSGASGVCTTNYRPKSDAPQTSSSHSGSTTRDIARCASNKSALTCGPHESQTIIVLSPRVTVRLSSGSGSALMMNTNGCYENDVRSLITDHRLPPPGATDHQSPITNHKARTTDPRLHVMPSCLPCRSPTKAGRAFCRRQSDRHGRSETGKSYAYRRRRAIWQVRQESAGHLPALARAAAICLRINWSWNAVHERPRSRSEEPQRLRLPQTRDVTRMPLTWTPAKNKGRRSTDNQSARVPRHLG